MSVPDSLGLSSYGDSNVPTHPMAGTLRLGLTSRVVIPRVTDTSYILQGELPVYDVFLLHSSITDNSLRGAFMAFYYSRFVLETGEENRTKEEVACAVLGLLLNSVDYVRIIRHNNKIASFCAQSGFIPIFREIYNPLEIEIICNSLETNRFINKFGYGRNIFMDNRNQQLVMLGPILLTIGKNIQVEGYMGWITKQVRAFMGTLGLENYNIIWTDPTYPSVTTMSQLSTFLSASFLLRRELFKMCWELASVQGRLGNLFRDVLSLLKGSGMTHIILIDEYLYTRHRELLTLRVLANNHKGMHAAWQFLAQLAPHEVYYAKILYDKEQTACLNRNNFPLHIAAAVAAAKIESPTMANYRWAESNFQSSVITTIVTEYISRKMNLAGHSLLNDQARFGSIHEAREELNKKKEEAKSSAAVIQMRGEPLDQQLPSPPAI
jgi:hypothetical protein